MSNVPKVLLVDDHPTTIHSYQVSLKEWCENNQTEMIIETAENCKKAFDKLQNSLLLGPYTIVILDIRLPPSDNNGILSGEDFGLRVRELSPKTSIIVMTAHGDSFRILNIVTNIEPEGFMIKSDVTPEEFKDCFTKVLKKEMHYSQSILIFMRRRLSTSFVISEHDRNILHYLAEGVRTIDLEKKLPISLASIEKRKRVMKEIFDVEKKGDIALINKARSLGFIT